MTNGLKSGSLLDHDKYRIERILGQGGFGITYLAVDLGLEKLRAIKEFFPKDYCDRDDTTSHITLGTAGASEFVERLKKKFIKEARNIANLDQHSGIITIHGVFEENNTAYYVMDYIEGENLSQMVKKSGPLSPEKAVKYILDVGDALDYVHRHHINHLDVKPANIMIRRKDESAILIDFGLAKQYDTTGLQTSTTPTGISHGYAPIEQYNDGGVKEFTPQTDVYSLAATLYYLLTGIVPPNATKLVEEDLSFPEDFPERLIPVILKAMTSRKSKRHESIKEFCRELKNADKNKDYQPEETVIQTDVKKPVVKPEPSVGTPQTDPEVVVKPASEPKSSSGKLTRNMIIGFLLVGCLIPILIIIGKRSDRNTYVDDWEGEPAAVEVETPVEAETTEPTDSVVVVAAEPATPKNGSSDYALTYMQYYHYMRGSGRNLYYDGYFSDSSGSYPITLRFHFNENDFPATCYYTNVNYKTKVTMEVMFTSDQMIIKGNAGGSNFSMYFEPTSNGRWEGTAANGNHRLSAAIWPANN